MLMTGIAFLAGGGFGIWLGSAHGDHKSILMGGIFMILGALTLGIEGNRYAQKK